MKALRSWVMGLGVPAIVLGLAGCDGNRAQPQQIPVSETSRPAFQEWVLPLIDQSITKAFPRSLECRGNVDVVTWRYRGKPPGSQVQGWSWNVGAAKPFERVLFTVDGKIVGGGHGGRDRPDVPKALPEIRSAVTGWEGLTSQIGGTLIAWGVDPVAGAACRLGEITL